MGQDMDARKMKVAELKSQLARRGLSTEGLKADLVLRLQARLDEEEFGDLEAPPPQEEEKPAEVPAATVKPDPPTPAKDASSPVQATVESVPKPADGVPPAKPDTKEPTTETKKAVVTIGDASKKDILEQKEARAKRFGVPVQLTETELEKKKRERAERFGIPLVESSSKKEKTPPQKKQKKEKTPTPKKKAVAALQVDLSKEEIEKRIARAEKFHTGDPETLEKLKAMLRKHRFEATN